MNVVDFWRSRCWHQVDKAAVDTGEPPQGTVIQGFLRDSPEKDGGSQYGEQDEDPESYPVVHLNEHAPAVGGHLPALGEVFSCEAHRVLSSRYRITCVVMCVIREETLKRVMKKCGTAWGLIVRLCHLTQFIPGLLTSVLPVLFINVCSHRTD